MTDVEYFIRYLTIVIKVMYKKIGASIFILSDLRATLNVHQVCTTFPLPN